MIKKAAVILLSIMIFLPFEAKAGDLTVEDAVELYRIDEADEALKGLGEAEDFSLKETVLDMLGGEWEFSLSGIVQRIARIVAGEAAEVIYIMKKVIVLVLLSAILEALSSSFMTAGVGKLGQHICTAVMIATVIRSFSFAAEAAESAVDTINGISTTLQPLYMLIMTSNGRAAEMTVAVPVLYASAAVINFAVKRLVIPAILLSALITFINCLSERDMLLELADLLSRLCKWGTRLCAGAFVFIMSLIKIGTPETAALAGKTIKAAAQAVPVAGPVMASAAETAAEIVSSIGNSVTAAVMVFIALSAAAPVVRLAVITLVYKFTAAVIEPVASKRIVKSVAKAADYAGILTGAVFTAELMFIIVTALMLAV